MLWTYEAGEEKNHFFTFHLEKEARRAMFVLGKNLIESKRKVKIHHINIYCSCNRLDNWTVRI